MDDGRHVLRGVGVGRAVYRELDPHTAQLDGGYDRDRDRDRCGVSARRG